MIIKKSKNLSWVTDILFLIVVLSLFFFIFLGSRELFVPDEGRYAEIGREMVTKGDYITPYLNGIKYFEKPILFYWLESIAIKLGGLNLWSIRSINGLLALISCVFTYYVARRLFDRLTGLLSAFILAINTLYFGMAHMISLDLTVTFFITASLYTFLLAFIFSETEFYLSLSSAAAGFAVLTKGLIGIFFPFLIICSWIAFFNEWQFCRKIFSFRCVIIFLIITLPWHFLIGWQNPEFFYFYFVEQHFLRYCQLNIGHYQPLWFFLPILLIGFFPWIIFLPQTLKTTLTPLKKIREKKIEIFFLLWAALIFIFFSFSKSKLIPYILPAIPPLSILTAHYLSQHIKHKLTWDFRLSIFVFFLMTVAIGLILVSFLSHKILPHPIQATRALSLAVFIVILGGIVSVIFSFLNRFKTLLSLIFFNAIFFIILIFTVPFVDSGSIYSFAQSLKPLLENGDTVIAYNQYYQDLPFYLGRQISVLNWRNELEFGMKHQTQHDWLIDDDQFWELWNGTQRVFVVLGLGEYHQFKKRYPQREFYLLAKTVNNALIVNQPIDFHTQRKST